MDLNKSLAWLEENKEMVAGISKQVWDFAETAFKEYKSSDLIASTLEDHGFEVERGAFGLETAFRATYGKGGPVIGFLGEYDALPGLSQEVSTEQKPIEAGKPGHGCGHNLLGTAPLGACLALRYGMESEDEATIVYYGCPAEELLIGKGYMAREGAFRDLDVAVSYHPMNHNMVADTTMSAIETARFHFKGKTSHAAADPWNGRSALDAAELMTTGANYLREHVMDGTRIHYIYEDAGKAPNIVPDTATLYFFARAYEREIAVDVFNRLVKCAEGAAIMTETQVEVEKVGGCYEILPNHALMDTMAEAMEESPRLEFTEEEKAFAEEINKKSPKYDQAVKDPNYEPINTDVMGKVKMVNSGSSDVGDVSQLVPTVFFLTAAQNSLAPNHSWDIVACNGMSIGQKGMIYAAENLVRWTDKLIKNPEIVDQAKAEFAEATKNKEYICPITEEMDYKNAIK